MAKEILVRDSLTTEMESAGKKLIERLDEIYSPVDAALWFFFSEDNIWRLLLSSELVRTEGPRKYYKKILEVNKKANPEELIIPLNDIGVTDNSNQIIKVIKSAISTGPSISGIRFSRNTVNGMFINDSYIYRI